MGTNVQEKSFRDSESFEDIVNRYVDSFFIDSFKISSTNCADGVEITFLSEDFGSCVVSKSQLTDIETDLAAMTQMANDELERHMTECASVGLALASDRPVLVPSGFSLSFAPLS